MGIKGGKGESAGARECSELIPLGQFKPGMNSIQQRGLARKRPWRNSFKQTTEACSWPCFTTGSDSRCCISGGYLCACCSSGSASFLLVTELLTSRRSPVSLVHSSPWDGTPVASYLPWRIKIQLLLLESSKTGQPPGVGLYYSLYTFLYTRVIPSVCDQEQLWGHREWLWCHLSLCAYKFLYCLLCSKQWNVGQLWKSAYDYPTFFLRKNGWNFTPLMPILALDFSATRTQ